MENLVLSEILELSWLVFILWIIPAILVLDLYYWMYKQEFVHYKKSYILSVKSKGKSLSQIKDNFLYEVPILQILFLSIIPIVNVIGYCTLVFGTMKDCYTYSNKYKLQDICLWKKGINSFIWRRWKPSGRWKKSFRIE